MSGMFPGCKHVEEFGPDDEYEDEVEECYVVLDLADAEQTLVPSSSTYRLIGLDTPSPLLQLSGTILKGAHKTLLGTELIFRDTTNDSNESHSTRHDIQHFCNSEQRIRFKEVELKHKGAKEPVTTKLREGGQAAVLDGSEVPLAMQSVFSIKDPNLEAQERSQTVFTRAAGEAMEVDE